MPVLKLLNKLKSNQPIVSTFMALGGFRHAQILAHTGLDAVIIDREHGYISDSETHQSVSTIAQAGCSPIVRVRGPSSDLIKRALDTGCHGLLVPMIHTAEEARNVVSYSKFPPQGTRGQGSAFACFEFPGCETPAEYVKVANEKVVVMVQIESRMGVENVEEIGRVDGVDVIFIGPNDLALALLGYTPAKYTEPEFLGAIDKIVEACRKFGKKVGMLVANGEEARKALERFDFVAIGTDVRALQAFYREQVGLARGGRGG